MTWNPQDGGSFEEIIAHLTVDQDGDGTPEQYGLALADHATVGNGVWPSLFYGNGGAVVEARSPAGQTVAWPYADPGGGEHHSLNCSIAQVTVRHAGRELRTGHGGVYELGIPPGAHGVELQPFPDG